MKKSYRQGLTVALIAGYHLLPWNAALLLHLFLGGRLFSKNTVLLLCLGAARLPYSPAKWLVKNHNRLSTAIGKSDDQTLSSSRLNVPGEVTVRWTVHRRLAESKHFARSRSVWVWLESTATPPGSTSWAA